MRRRLAETTEDGWLMSETSARSMRMVSVYITGRKKEIYVNSGGKNIAPLVIEETTINTGGIAVLLGVETRGNSALRC